MAQNQDPNADDAQAGPAGPQANVPVPPPQVIARPGNQVLINQLLEGLAVSLSGRRTIRTCLVGERVRRRGDRRWYCVLQARSRYLQNGRMGSGLLKNLQHDTYLAAEWLVTLLPNSIRINATQAEIQDGQLNVTDAVWLAHIKQIVTHLSGAEGARNNLGEPVAVNAADLEQCYAGLEFYTEAQNRSWERAVPAAIALVVTTLSKQGNVSPSWISRRVDEMSSEANVAYNWTREEVHTLWLHFCSQIQLDEVGWELLFDSLDATIPPSFNRLRLVCQQAKYSGMTAYKIISQMRASHTRFPWVKFEQMVGEVDRWNTFEQQCADHPYLMFTRGGAQRENIQISRVPGLLHLSISLARINNPNSSLANYRGLDNIEVPKRRKIETWVDAYVTQIDKAEVDFPGLIEIDED